MNHVHIDRHGNALPSSRVPQSLQHVILASNRGLDVHVPPPQSAGNKVFYRGWLGRTFSTESREATVEKSTKGFSSRFLATRRKGSKREESFVVPTEIAVVKDKGPKPVESIDKRSSRAASLSPQQYLDSMIGNRGYSVTSYAALESAYYSKPTALQVASYGTDVIRLVQTGQIEHLRSALACGISANACNAYGESLLHAICRRGDDKLLHVMMEAGCDLQVADDHGRTLLHEACWAVEPAFSVVQLLMEHDKNLFYVADARGALPLSYVKRDQWSCWLQFLVSWTGESIPSPLTLQLPNTKSVAPPNNALTLELARMVADGKLLPDEARCVMLQESDDDSSVARDDDSIDGLSADSESRRVSQHCEAEQERMQILRNLGSRRPVPLVW